jgi:hypothetical protein
MLFERSRTHGADSAARPPRRLGRAAKERARQNHRSLRGEIKAILEKAAPLATRVEALAIADKWQRYWQEQGKTFSDSAEMIRRMRDA